MDQNKITVKMGMIIDATLSFSMIYPQIYYMIHQLLVNIDEKSSEIENVAFKYGITLLHDNEENVIFPNGELFTEDINSVFDTLQNLSFYGGEDNGLEDINRALDSQIRVMNDSKSKFGENDQKGLLMFTDSLPADGMHFPDYTNSESVRNGFRFSYFYAYNDDFIPQIRMVDQNGLLTDNNINVCIYESINTLLKQNEEQFNKYIQEMADRIIYQVTA